MCGYSLSNCIWISNWLLSDKYASIGGTCYFFDTVLQTKSEAKEKCIQNDGKLWEPNSIEIINQVYSKAQEVYGSTEDIRVWVGISDAASEGTFKFESNEEIFPFTPQNAPWNGNEPNGGATENCVFMGMKQTFAMKFFDVKCTDGRKYGSICETSDDKCPQAFGGMYYILPKFNNSWFSSFFCDSLHFGIAFGTKNYKIWGPPV